MDDLSFLSPNLQELFEAYIRLDTSKETGENYLKAIELLENYLSSIGFETNRYPIPESVTSKPNRIHLVARKSNPHKPTLLIYNHIDVVPASYKDAFTLKIEKGRVYGRGTADHKGSTVAVLAALEDLKNQDLNFNVVCWFTTDEETDQLDQLRWMTDKLKIPTDTIIFDPDTFAGGVTVGHLGLLQLQVKVFGKSAHSGMSNLGINAIEQAGKLIQGFFRPIQQEYEAKISHTKPFPSNGIERMCSRCNVNKIQGGVAANVIPDICEFTVDCRFIPEAQVEHEKNNLCKRLEEYCKKESISYEVEVTQMLYGHAVTHPMASRLAQMYEKSGGELGLYGAMGSTPLAHWSSEQNLVHVGIGVGRAESNFHGLNESAAIDDIFKLTQTMKLFLTSGLS